MATNQVFCMINPHIGYKVDKANTGLRVKVTGEVLLLETCDFRCCFQRNVFREMSIDIPLNFSQASVILKRGVSDAGGI